MEILSISIDDETLDKLNKIQKELGFKSRSKLLRSAILNIVKDYETIDISDSSIECVFAITYSEKEKNHVSDILHKFKSIIKTEIHHHSYNKGVEIIIISGKSSVVKELFTILRKNKCVQSVNFLMLEKKQ